jgi:hypothetical protein
MRPARQKGLRQVEQLDLAIVDEADAHIAVKQNNADVDAIQRVSQHPQHRFVRLGDQEMMHLRFFAPSGSVRLRRVFPASD